MPPGPPDRVITTTCSVTLIPLVSSALPFSYHPYSLRRHPLSSSDMHVQKQVNKTSPQDAIDQSHFKKDFSGKVLPSGALFTGEERLGAIR